MMILNYCAISFPWQVAAVAQAVAVVHSRWQELLLVQDNTFGTSAARVVVLLLDSMALDNIHHTPLQA